MSIQDFGDLERVSHTHIIENFSGRLVPTDPNTLHLSSQLAVESKIDELVHGVLAEVAGYSILFAMFGQRHHRYL